MAHIFFRNLLTMINAVWEYSVVDVEALTK
jgi:hypothetical protein